MRVHPYDLILIQEVDPWLLMLMSCFKELLILKMLVARAVEFGQLPPSHHIKNTVRKSNEPFSQRQENPCKLEQAEIVRRVKHSGQILIIAV